MADKGKPNYTTYLDKLTGFLIIEANRPVIVKPLSSRE